MTGIDMFGSLFGLGIALFFSWFLFLSVITDSCLETGLYVFISLFMTVLGVVLRYLCLRIRKLEMQVDYLMHHAVRKTDP